MCAKCRVQAAGGRPTTRSSGDFGRVDPDVPERGLAMPLQRARDKACRWRGAKTGTRRGVGATGTRWREPPAPGLRPWPISAWTWAAAPAPAQAEPSSVFAGGGPFGGGGGGAAGGGPGGGAGGPPKFPGRGDDGLADVLGVDSGAPLDEDATAPLDVWNSWRTSASWGSAETSGGTLCGSVQGRHGSRESTMAWTCPGCSAENTPMNHAHRILTRQRQLKNA